MSYYGNLDILEINGMDREEGEENIYINSGPINSPDVRTRRENSGIKTNQTAKHTESDSVGIRSSSMFGALACLVLLCFLLLTAVIALSVLISTINANYTQERDELLIKTTNLTEERTHLMIRLTNLTKERDQLKNKNMELTQERNQLSSKNNELTEQRDLLNQEKNKLLKNLYQTDGWTYYQSSLYFISSQKKTWAESRRYCTEKGADLIIINNREEQNFAKKTSASAKVWIGLTDSDVEGKWKWVDGNIPTITFWGPQEPDSRVGDEDCVLTVPLGWADYPCNDEFQWICEKRIFK